MQFFVIKTIISLEIHNKYGWVTNLGWIAPDCMLIVYKIVQDGEVRAYRCHHSKKHKDNLFLYWFTTLDP